MTPFSTALSKTASTAQAIMPRTKVQHKTPTIPAPKSKPSPKNAQVVAYEKAMSNATKNTKLYK